MRILAQGQWAWIRRPDYTKGEITNLIYCPVCADHVSGHLDPLWENCADIGVTQKQILARCHVCKSKSN